MYIFLIFKINKELLEVLNFYIGYMIIIKLMVLKLFCYVLVNKWKFINVCKKIVVKKNFWMNFK